MPVFVHFLVRDQRSVFGYSLSESLELFFEWSDMKLAGNFGNLNTLGHSGDDVDPAEDGAGFLF